LLVFTGVQAQFEIPEKPSSQSKQTAVFDYADILTDEQELQLKEKLVHYADSTSNQIVIATIPSLEGEAISEVTTNWAQKWGIGQADKDNGIFILIAPNEHKYFTSAGYGLEDKLTAGRLGQLGRELLVPAFKEQDYAGGLNTYTDALIQIIAGKYKEERKRTDSDDGLGLIPILVLVIVFILILVFRSNNRNNRGGRGGGGMGLGEALILGSLLRGNSGWGSGGSSGGGFSGGFGGGFGGGGFSGGGAGGSW
jgi:uncharacterized protein